MSRTLSGPAVAGLMAQQTAEVYLELLTITHDDLAAPLYFVNNTTNVTSRGNEYIAFPYKLILPQDSEETMPRTTLQIDNVDRQIVDTIRSISSPPSLSIEIVLASSPDTVELEALGMRLEQAKYDVMEVTGALVFEDILSQAFPSHRFDPSTTPAIF